MSGRTYRVTGINLKGIPLGESDRIITILTREQGLIRAVAKGSRKQPSKLGGRMEQFVINDLLIARGRWPAQTDASQRLQRIAQAETLQSFPRLSRSLAHLTAAQYLAEVTLILALSDQTQDDLFVLLVEHLERLEQAPDPQVVLPLLTHGLYHLLALAGFAPQVQACHYCRGELAGDVFFSPKSGGMVCEPCRVAQRPNPISLVSAVVLGALGSLPNPTLPVLEDALPLAAWLGTERLLRRILEHHAEREIRSAGLLASCYAVALSEESVPLSNGQGSPDVGMALPEVFAGQNGGNLKKL
ncbi:DNA repair protein RecO [Synechococcus sp. Nb3U1]|uniref:DNA repair protein RecO n=1 Tax=Synechococcus sp. Nb3U1 TaxID=1914529 RepID=UPI001F259EC6|nr:DNA repair protein RecO [Synechococcus sp. Nb3U1]MCF2971570.1 DNA repair protein RecO [Synechococcus sp. Nb3U1]